MQVNASKIFPTKNASQNDTVAHQPIATHNHDDDDGSVLSEYRVEHQNSKPDTSTLNIKSKFQAMTEHTMKTLEGFALWTAFNLGLTDDANYSFDRYIEKIFRDKIVEEQTKEHSDKEMLFYWIHKNDLEEIKNLLAKNPKLIKQRDVAGATPIHVAYLVCQYNIAHWLVERYPLVGLWPYGSKISSKIKSDNEFTYDFTEDMMPFTGETILHMVIVRRNHAEVRWILDFYNDHKHTVPGGLASLLTSNATGMFFSPEGDLFFGGFPLHFAVCANDTSIFDLVLAFSSTINIEESMSNSTQSTRYGQKTVKNTDGASSADKSEKAGYRTDQHFGSNVIFMRDNYGNTVLHLCVLHCLPDMYIHVHKTAQSIITRELKIHYPRECYSEKPIGSVIDLYKYEFTDTAATTSVMVTNNGNDNDGGNNNNNVTSKSVTNGHVVKGYRVIPRDVRLPRQEKLNDWLEKETRIKMEERLTLSLNADLHSPLTLAASQIMSQSLETTKSIETKNDKRVAMLEFLLSHLKQELWCYGPVTCNLLKLEGVEIKYNRSEYPELKQVTHRQHVMGYVMRYFGGIVKLVRWIRGIETKEKRQHNVYLFSAIEWICRNDADKAIVIPEIRKIVEIKWERFGYPKFLISLFINATVCIFITLILIFVNSTPTKEPKDPKHDSEYVVNFLYATLVLIFLGIFMGEMSFLFNHPQSYFNMQGVVRFSKRCRWIKMVSFAIFCCLKANASANGNTNNYVANYRNRDNTYYYPQDFVGVKICLTICVLASWIHMYYFLMGFDRTGPFILTIFRIVARDVPYFMRFYMIVVIAFACVLSMLANNGDYHGYQGFYLLLQGIYTLIQRTVNAEPTHDTLQGDGMPLFSNVPKDLQWLADIVLTGYYCVVVLIMLNLLIAMINNTYAQYTDYSESLLLMEKYNIMHAMELSMSKEELRVYRNKFAITSLADNHDDNEFFAPRPSDNSSVKLIGNGPNKNNFASVRNLLNTLNHTDIVTAPPAADDIGSALLRNNSTQSNPVADPITGGGDGVNGSDKVVAKKIESEKYSFEMQDASETWWHQQDSKPSSVTVGVATEARTTATVSVDMNTDAIVSAVLAALSTKHNEMQANIASIAQSVQLMQQIQLQSPIAAGFSPQQLDSTDKSFLRRKSLTLPLPIAPPLKDSGVIIRKSTVMSTLFLIDPQIDFHPEGGDKYEMDENGDFLLDEKGEKIWDKKSSFYHPTGSLAVAGANEDSQRIADMILENKANIREIFVSLDSHYPTHIAHAMFWVGRDGVTRPQVFSQIRHQDILEGEWRPRVKDDKLLEWCLSYTKGLERKGRMVLTIWPPHCIVGSRGHAIVPVVNNALQEWAKFSKRPITYILKGQNCRTEMYSAIEAEVEDPLDGSTGTNCELIDMLKVSDQLIICGQAMSHCVNYTLRDLVSHWHADVSKLVLLKDGASPVYGCQSMADELFIFCKKQGVTISTTTEVFNETNPI